MAQDRVSSETAIPWPIFPVMKLQWQDYALSVGYLGSNGLSKGSLDRSSKRNATENIISRGSGSSAQGQGRYCQRYVDLWKSSSRFWPITWASSFTVKIGKKAKNRLLSGHDPETSNGWNNSFGYCSWNHRVEVTSDQKPWVIDHVKLSSSVRSISEIIGGTNTIQIR